VGFLKRARMGTGFAHRLPHLFSSAMIGILYLLILLSIAMLVIGCGGPVDTPSPVLIRVSGSTSMQPLLADLAATYQETHPLVTVEVSGEGSALGLELALAGSVDLGATSLHPSQVPTGTLGGDPTILWVAPIALDGIAVIVHPRNPVQELTLLQLRDIFSGRRWHWDEMGSRGGVIQVVSREEGSGTRAVFEALVMGDRKVTPTAVLMPSSQAVVEYVAEHEGAIGYVSMGWLSSAVKALAVEGVLPTPLSVRRGEYHLTRPLFLVAPEEPSGPVRSWVDFILGPAGQDIVAKKYASVRGY